MNLKKALFEKVAALTILAALTGCGTFQDQSGIDVNSPDSAQTNSNAAPTAIESTPTPLPTTEITENIPSNDVDDGNTPGKVELPPESTDDESTDDIVVAENEVKVIIGKRFKYRRKVVLRHHAKIMIKDSSFENGIDLEAFDDALVEVENSELTFEKCGRNSNTHNRARIRFKKKDSDDPNESMRLR